MLGLLDRLSPADCLQLLAFEAELRRLPRPFLDALWAGVDALEREGSARSRVELSGAAPPPS